MADVRHQVSVIIGAALKGGFREVLSTSRDEFLKLGNVIKELDSSNFGILNKFDNLRQKTLELKRSWKESEAEVRQLAEGIRGVETPTAAMVKEFKNSQIAAAKAKEAYIGKRDALHKLSKQIRESGVDMEALSIRQTEVGETLKNLKENYNELNGIMLQQDAVKRRREAYHSEIIDIIALGKTLSLPINAAMEYETAMAEVDKIVHFPSLEALKEFGDELMKLTRRMPLSFKDIARIAESGAQLGIPVKDLAYFTELVAEMSTTYNMTAEEAGRAVATLSNVFRIPVLEMRNFGDVINHLGNKTVARARDIIPALNRMGGAIIQFGLTAPQAAAMAATLVAVGVSSEKTGTAVSAMLNRLMTIDRDGPKVSEAFERIGISVKKMKETMVENPQKALLDMFDMVIKNVEKIERAGELRDIFGKHYQLYAAQLVESAETYKDILKLIENPESYKDSVHKEFVRRTQTVASHLQLISNSFGEIATNIGTTILPALGDFAEKIRVVTDAIADYAEGHRDVIKWIMSAVASLMACKIAAVTLGYAWTFVKGGALSLLEIFKRTQIILGLFQMKLLTVRAALPAVVAAFRSLGAAMKANPIGAAVSALALGATLIIANWQKVKDFFEDIWSDVAPHWNSFIDKIKSLNVADKIMASWQKLKAFFTSIWDDIAPKWDAFAAPLSKLWDGAKSSVSGVGSLLNANENRPSIASKLPPLNGAKNASPVTKNQNTNVTVNVNASKISDPKEVAKTVGKEMQDFNWGFLYDPVGELP